MVKSKKLFTFIFVFLPIVFQPGITSAQQQPHTLEKVKILVNQEALALDQPPVMLDNRILVPFRSIFEGLGATVQWDSTTRTITATRDDNQVNVTIGKKTMIRNGETVPMDVPAIVLHGRTFVPIRFVSESLGATVAWDDANQTISVDDPASASKQSINPNNLNVLASRSNGMSSSRLINLASSLVGIPYVWGGSDPQGFDCSGLTSYLMKQFGVTLPRTAAEQFQAGYPSISTDQLAIGDLLFFGTSKVDEIDHVGIYIGNNKMVHAASKGVKISNLDWYFKHYKYYGARRVLTSS